MGKEDESEFDSKWQLVKQICDISNRAVSCAQSHHHTTLPFIDWYLLLQVEENVGVDIIRKKYHKYALQLHPDKNKHPKAEFAFKLVSEAYVCLSDDATRAAFDIKRWKYLCKKCIKTPKMKTKVKNLASPSESVRSNKMVERVKEIKARLMEEARVIENCLKAKTSKMEPQNVNLFEKEIPIFNPNDYLSQGYPHFRVWKCNKKAESFWHLQKEYRYEQTKRDCDSPIFDCKPKKSSYKIEAI